MSAPELAPPQAPAARAERFVYLDALRGLAAFAVFLGHYALGFGAPRGFESPLLSLTYDAYAAVSIFFVLSGFVLAYGPLRQPRAGSGWLRGFYLGRALRLYPPYWAALALSFLGWRYLFVGILTDPPGDALFFYGFWFSAELPGWAGAGSEIFMLDPRASFRWIPQAWTLMAEVYLSILLPPLLWLLRRSAVGFYALALALLPFWTPPVELLLLRWALLHFMLGIAIAYQHRWWTSSSPFRHRALAGVGVLVGCTLLHFPSTPWAPSTFDPTLRYISALGAAILIAALISQPAFGRVLEARWLRYLGRISYSLYLCHLGVLFLFTPRFLAYINSLGIGGETARWLGLAATTPVVLALSHLLHRFVEEPSMQLGRRLRSRA